MDTISNKKKRRDFVLLMCVERESVRMGVRVLNPSMQSSAEPRHAPKPKSLDEGIEDIESSAEEETASPGIDNVLGRIIRRINKKFLNDGGKEKSYQIYAKGAPHPADQGNSTNILDYFDYLGRMRTTSSPYREQMMEYAEKKKGEEVHVRAKTQDMTYKEFETIVQHKKLVNMFGKGLERINAYAAEKWKIMRIFAHYQVLSMLRYSSSMT